MNLSAMGLTSSGRLKIGGLGIPSHYFLAPINTGFARDGAPDERLLEFHRARSGNLIGASYVGNVAVNEDVRTNSGTLVMHAGSHSSWMRLSTAIEENGSVPAVQLACRRSPIKTQQRWKHSNVPALKQAFRGFLRTLPRESILETCRQFVDASQAAAQSGFRIVQIHAAHGYFLSLLLSRELNPRTDEFAFDAMTAFKYILSRVRDVEPEVVLDVRVSLFDGLEQAEEERSYRRDQIRALAEIGFDMVSLSAGLYDVDRNLIYPGRKQPRETYLPLALSLAQELPGTTWNVAGNVRNVMTGFPKNLTLGIGRPLIADPQFVVKTLSGRLDEVTECGYHGHCHYFTRGGDHIQCAVNEDV